MNTENSVYCKSTLDRMIINKYLFVIGRRVEEVCKVEGIAVDSTVVVEVDFL